MFSYDLTSPVGKVRLLIADTQEHLKRFDDEEIQALLDLDAYEGEYSLLRAGARCLEIMAADALWTLKVIQVLDLKTDGAAVARALRQQAEVWKQEASAEESFFEVFEIINSIPAYEDYRMRLWGAC